MINIFEVEDSSPHIQQVFADSVDDNDCQDGFEKKHDGHDCHDVGAGAREQHGVPGGRLREGGRTLHRSYRPWQVQPYFVLKQVGL